MSNEISKDARKAQLKVLAGIEAARKARVESGEELRIVPPGYDKKTNARTLLLSYIDGFPDDLGSMKKAHGNLIRILQKLGKKSEFDPLTVNDVIQSGNHGAENPQANDYKSAIKNTIIKAFDVFDEAKFKLFSREIRDVIGVSVGNSR